MQNLMIANHMSGNILSTTKWLGLLSVALCLMQVVHSVDLIDDMVITPPREPNRLPLAAADEAQPSSTPDLMPLLADSEPSASQEGSSALAANEPEEIKYDANYKSILQKLIQDLEESPSQLLEDCVEWRTKTALYEEHYGKLPETESKQRKDKECAELESAVVKADSFFDEFMELFDKVDFVKVRNLIDKYLEMGDATNKHHEVSKKLFSKQRSDARFGDAMNEMLNMAITLTLARFVERSPEEYGLENSESEEEEEGHESDIDFVHGLADRYIDHENSLNKEDLRILPMAMVSLRIALQNPNLNKSSAKYRYMVGTHDALDIIVSNIRAKSELGSSKPSGELPTMETQ